jgi:hypothetical protein
MSGIKLYKLEGSETQALLDDEPTYSVECTVDGEWPAEFLDGNYQFEKLSLAVEHAKKHAERYPRRTPVRVWNVITAECVFEIIEATQINPPQGDNAMGEEGS